MLYSSKSFYNSLIVAVEGGVAVPHHLAVVQEAVVAVASVATVIL